MSRTITLTKGGHKYVFRYGGGDELAVVDELIRLARCGQSQLGWPDAASLSHQLACQTAQDVHGGWER